MIRTARRISRLASIGHHSLYGDLSSRRSPAREDDGKLETKKLHFLHLVLAIENTPVFALCSDRASAISRSSAGRLAFVPGTP